MRIGLTGGIGSGKSAVARLFSGWGAAVIDADLLAREVVGPGTPGLGQIAAIWPSVVTSEGSLDRAALSHIVFADSDALERLTAIIHPRVREAAALREAACAAGTIVVHAVPLLFEGDYWKTCDANVLVVAPAATRIARVIARDGVRASDVEARMAVQIEPERAMTMADFVVRNDADFATLERRARDVYDVLRRGPATA